MPCAARTCVSLMPPAPSMPIRTTVECEQVANRPYFRRGPNLDLSVPDLCRRDPARRMCPFCGVPNRATSLNLLAAIAAFSAGEPSSYVSTLLAVQPVLDVRTLDGDLRCCSTRRRACSGRFSAGEHVIQRRGLALRADLRVRRAARRRSSGTRARYAESMSSRTKYFRPLFPPSATRQSHASSNWP